MLVLSLTSLHRPPQHWSDYHTLLAGDHSSLEEVTKQTALHRVCAPLVSALSGQVRRIQPGLLMRRITPHAET